MDPGAYIRKKQAFDNTNYFNPNNVANKSNLIQKIFFGNENNSNKSMPQTHINNSNFNDNSLNLNGYNYNNNTNMNINSSQLPNNDLIPNYANNNNINNNFSDAEQNYNNNPINGINNNTIDISYLNNFETRNPNNNYGNHQASSNFAQINPPQPNYEILNNNNPLSYTMRNNKNNDLNNLNNLNGTSNDSPLKNNVLSNTLRSARAVGSISSYKRQEDFDEKNKKRNLLEDIQQQIMNNKNTKLNELMKKRMEDQKYLSDLNTYNPFGRNGAGAPLRDTTGNVITKRRALISDNKKLNDSIGNIKVEDLFPGNQIINNSNTNINSILNNLTQKISANGLTSLGTNLMNYSNINNNQQRYNSARVMVSACFFILIHKFFFLIY